VGHSKKKRQGRARGASAETMFGLAPEGMASSRREPVRKSNDHKTMQLCRQAQRATWNG